MGCAVHLVSETETSDVLPVKAPEVSAQTLFSHRLEPKSSLPLEAGLATKLTEEQCQGRQGLVVSRPALECRGGDQLQTEGG